MNQFESARQSYMTTARESLARALEIDLVALRREDLGDEMKFSEALTGFLLAIGILERIPAESLDKLNTTHILEIKGACDQLLALNERARTFTLRQEGSVAIHAQLLRDLSSVFDTVAPGLIAPLVLASNRDHVKESGDAATAVRKTADELKHEMDKRLTEADGVLKAIRQASEHTAVTRYATIFETEAKAHDDSAFRWLIATGGLLSALLILAAASIYFAFDAGMKNLTLSQSVQISVGKALIVASLAFFASLTSRSYLAHRHNAVVNRQRQNNLLTYKAIVEAAGTEDSRNIVLTRAAECIFAQQTTGYTRTDGDESKAFSMVTLGANLTRSSGQGG